jgi:hypothetical protein
MKMILGYTERVIGRRIPDYMYYIAIPIFYALTDSYDKVPFLVGVITHMAEIQNSIFVDEKQNEEGEFVHGAMANIFLNCLLEFDSDLARHLGTLIDISNRDNLEKFEAWLKPIIT